ncbi:MAG: transposase [Janthinobacterium lividum]
MEDKQVVAVTPRTARRSFSKQFKRELVRQALLPDVSRAALALANGINANQLARWCREHFRAEHPINAAKLIAVTVDGPAISDSEPVRLSAEQLGEIDGAMPMPA